MGYRVLSSSKNFNIPAKLCLRAFCAFYLLRFRNLLAVKDIYILDAYKARLALVSC